MQRSPEPPPFFDSASCVSTGLGQTPRREVVSDGRIHTFSGSCGGEKSPRRIDGNHRELHDLNASSGSSSLRLGKYDGCGSSIGGTSGSDHTISSHGSTSPIRSSHACSSTSTCTSYLSTTTPTTITSSSSNSCSSSSSSSSVKRLKMRCYHCLQINQWLSARFLSTSEHRLAKILDVRHRAGASKNSDVFVSVAAPTTPMTTSTSVSTPTSSGESIAATTTPTPDQFEYYVHYRDFNRRMDCWREFDDLLPVDASGKPIDEERRKRMIEAIRNRRIQMMEEEGSNETDNHVAASSTSSSLSSSSSSLSSAITSSASKSAFWNFSCAGEEEDEQGGNIVDWVNGEERSSCHSSGREGGGGVDGSGGWRKLHELSSSGSSGSRGTSNGSSSNSSSSSSNSSSNSSSGSGIGICTIRSYPGCRYCAFEMMSANSATKSSTISSPQSPPYLNDVRMRLLLFDQSIQFSDDEEDPEEHEGMDKAALLAHEEATKVKNINKIQIGTYELETWYFSPFPTEFQNLDILFICEWCFGFFNLESELRRHSLRCNLRHPPGDEIYRDGK